MKKYIIISFLTLIVLPLYAHPPIWEPIEGTEYSMVLMGKIFIDNSPFEGTGENMAAAFGPAHCDTLNDCRSLGSWQEPNPPYWDGYWYFTIVGNENGDSISFKIYDYANDKIYDCMETVLFENDTTIGSPYSPMNLTCLPPPSNLNIYISGGDVILTWEPVLITDIYNIFRSTDPFSGFTKIDTCSNNSYTDNNAASGSINFYYYVTTYKYK